MAHKKHLFDFINKFKSFDVFTKPLDDFQEKTLYGGFVTLVCWVAMFYVVSYECYNYLKTSWKEEIFVDISSGSKLQMHLDMIIPAISCDYLSIDSVDSAGDQHLDIDYNIYKRRLNNKGEPIEDPKKDDYKIRNETGLIAKNTTQHIGHGENSTRACGSCYGAESDEIKCCNTCAEVRAAYRKKNWNFLPEKFDQCKDEFRPNKTNIFDEGCQIYGYIEVNRVGGSFHIAPGQSFSINHIHIHDIHPYSSSMFNTTHYIRHLSFGRKWESMQGIQVSPLNGHIGMATEGATMFHYFIKLIPTMIERNNGFVFHTNQFSVTKFSKKPQLKSDSSSMPGIFFSYELSPLMVKRTEEHKSLGHLITTILSYISGVYIAALLTDSFLHRIAKYMKKLQNEKNI